MLKGIVSDAPAVSDWRLFAEYSSAEGHKATTIFPSSFVSVSSITLSVERYLALNNNGVVIGLRDG